MLKKNKLVIICQYDCFGSERKGSKPFLSMPKLFTGFNVLLLRAPTYGLNLILLQGALAFTHLGLFLGGLPLSWFAFVWIFVWEVYGWKCSQECLLSPSWIPIGFSLVQVGHVEMQGVASSLYIIQLLRLLDHHVFLRIIDPYWFVLVPRINVANIQAILPVNH